MKGLTSGVPSFSTNKLVTSWEKLTTSFDHSSTSLGMNESLADFFSYFYASANIAFSKISETETDLFLVTGGLGAFCRI